jgi:hypothetical protein
MARATSRAVQDYLDGGMIYIALALFTVSLTFVDFRWRCTSPYRQDIYYLLGLCPFLVAYVIANNGWTTTYCPLMGILLLLTAMVGWEALWLQSEYARQGLSTKLFRFSARAKTWNGCACQKRLEDVLSSFDLRDCTGVECPLGAARTLQVFRVSLR